MELNARTFTKPANYFKMHRSAGFYFMQNLIHSRKYFGLSRTSTQIFCLHAKKPFVI